jgi:hypothetical protein
LKPAQAGLVVVLVMNEKDTFDVVMVYKFFEVLFGFGWFSMF